MSDNKEVFFHVGLGKVASTYLQYKVFPKFSNICYIQRTRYWKAPELIKKSPHTKFLISREFDKYLEREAKFISSHFPDAKPILILRRHDSWIASQYRRYAKNGYPLSFTEFFDHKNDTGKWGMKELRFYDKIKILEKYFSNKPLVLFYDDMKEDTMGFIDRLASYMGVEYNPKDISLGRKHISYNEKQMKASMAVGKHINIQPHIRLNNKVLDKLRHFYVASIRYITLYTALILPDSLFTKEELLPKSMLQEIREYYQEDWEKCHEYAQENNP